MKGDLLYKRSNISTRYCAKIKGLVSTCEWCFQHVGFYRIFYSGIAEEIHVFFSGQLEGYSIVDK